MSALRHVRRACPVGAPACALALGGALPYPGGRALHAQPAARDGRLASPEQFFGFQMGADRKMARWDRMVEYYKALEKQSDRLKVVEMGPTSMGNPFLALYISSPRNLARLEQLRQISTRLADPRGVDEVEIRRLVADGRAVVLQTMSMHANEIGGSQMAPELVYDLLQRNDEETQRILDNVVSIIVPSFNPDGQIMLTDWYRKNVGTEYEGSNYHSLYQKYVGHDNNRDAFMQNMVESRYVGGLLFRDWIPQAYVDHHHMGSYGARIYLPPYADPIRPAADPLVWRELSWYGAHMAYKEEEADKSGVINYAIYSGWGHMGFHWITPFHNIAGMLTESASARLATPLYIHPDQLQGNTRNLPVYEAQTTFPNPWPGGWWRLRDIVERQKISAWATLDLAARNREMVLWNAYLKAKRQTERGAMGKPAAFVIPAEQHDPLTMGKMVNALLRQGVDVRRASSGFTHEGRVYGAGTYVVSMAQPKMGVVRWLLGRTFYPDNSYTREADGDPIRPYDMSTDTMNEFMGVRTDPVDTPVSVDLARVVDSLAPAGTVARGSAGYRLDGRLNESFRAVNLLLDRGIAVRRADRALGTGSTALRAGDFVVPDAPAAVATDVARRTGVDFQALTGDAASASHALRRQRVAMYNRYGGGNMDEGWTEFVLEQAAFPFKTIMDAELKAGKLNDRYDVIILPSDNVAALTGERGAGAGARGGGGGAAGATPPEYRTGFGAEGVAALRSFVEAGGTLVTFAESGWLPISRFGVPVREIVTELPAKTFWSPGSTLRVAFDTGHPLAYGMPNEGLAVFTAGSQVYEIAPTATNERVETIATYADRDILRSGWLIGEQVIARKAAMVSAQMGRGRVVLIGFRPQHRSQAHGTFKLMFNALMNGPPSGDAAADRAASMR